MRLALLAALLLASCGGGAEEKGDGGSPPAGSADAAPGDTTASCMLDGDCAPGEACRGALPGVVRSGHCAARGDRGIAEECIAP